jgi:VRR-NUC domain
MKIGKLSTAKINEVQFPFDPQLREKFGKGSLAVRWQHDYPLLFDKDDVRLARNQPSHHFYEWLAAILLYKSTGYLSLVEKYQFENHARKQALLAELMDDRLRKALSLIKRNGRGQAPDLLLYTPDKKKWMFCEVKGESDRLSEKQRARFLELSIIVQDPVWLLKFVRL